MLRLIGRCATALAVTASMWAATSAPANAQATDAVNGCGAEVLDNESAYVKPDKRGDKLWTLRTTEGSFVVKCGDGQDWGAAHVELKHEVPTWADALTCIENAINRGVASDGENGKTNYVYRIKGAVVVVVVGIQGLVTAYPKGTGIARKWRLCSAS
ncbi:hypothetical protein OG984_23145 [Nocardioides sp. NBC_00368]|uniref:hypothetical protein n=1 Tax=Nocardioides sp. NBC_00368 TaxID=2976000 RepID=UPI002E1B34E3